MRQRKGRAPIHPGQHPAVVFLDDEIGRRRIPAYHVARRAGLCQDTISAWRRGSSPSVGNLDAALNVLGYRLVVVPLQQSGAESGAGVET